MPIYPELREKVAIVTGGSAGIGESTALQLAASGARVAVVGRDRERGEAVAARAGRHSAESFNAKIQADPAVLDRRLPAIPMHRLAHPDEQAALVVFLCSDAASYVTGAALDGSGGKLLH